MKITFKQIYQEKLISIFFSKNIKDFIINEKINRKEISRIEKNNYIIKKETWQDGNMKPLKMENVYTKSGTWIGDVKTAKFICDKMGIKPEKASSNHNICSIGFQEKEQKWYGWSHRAICGFGIGDKIFDSSFGGENTPFNKHGKIKIKNLDQAKEAAIKFAKYIG